MIKYQVYNQKGEAKDQIELSEKVFGVPVEESLLHQAVISGRANSRKVLAHVKDRSEVRGGGRKPWRQKGTGRARAGSNRSPLWKGGGKTFGPTVDKNFSRQMTKKSKQKAMLMVLSDKVTDKTMVVVDKLTFDDYKTKEMNAVISQLEAKVLQNTDKRHMLIINPDHNEKLQASARNLEYIKVINPENINILDLLKFRNILLTVDTVKKLEEKYS